MLYDTQSHLGHFLLKVQTNLELSMNVICSKYSRRSSRAQDATSTLYPLSFFSVTAQRAQHKEEGCSLLCFHSDRMLGAGSWVAEELTISLERACQWLPPGLADSGGLACPCSAVFSAHSAQPLSKNCLLQNGYTFPRLMESWSQRGVPELRFKYYKWLHNRLCVLLTASSLENESGKYL